MENYNVYDKIGQGRFSTVYKGRKRKTIRYVALKSVEKAQKGRILNAVSILHKLTHPNVVRFIGWYETTRHIWVISEYCTGGNLFKLLQDDKRLPESTVKGFARDIFAGLQYVHSKGIIFVDMKPSNVLLNEHGQLKLSDFELAVAIPKDRTAGSQSPRMIRGSPYYLAPELFQPDGVHSFASDIWAVGCILYELSAGHPPFYSRSLQELMTSILSPASTPPTLLNVTLAFSSLIERCLDKNPATRITWPELRSHAFLTGAEGLPAVDLPPQPVFEQMHGLSVSSQHQRSASAALSPEPMVRTTSGRRPSPQPPAVRHEDVPFVTPSKTLSRDASAGDLKGSPLPTIPTPNVLRLSLNAKRNLLEEQELQHRSGETKSGGSEPSNSNSHSGSSGQPERSLAVTSPARPGSHDVMEDLQAEVAKEAAAAAGQASAADEIEEDIIPEDETPVKRSDTKDARFELERSTSETRLTGNRSDHDRTLPSPDKYSTSRVKSSAERKTPAAAKPGTPGSRTRAKPAAGDGSTDVLLDTCDAEIDFSDPAPAQPAAKQLAVPGSGAAVVVPGGASPAGTPPRQESSTPGGSPSDLRFSEAERKTSPAKKLQVDVAQTRPKTTGSALKSDLPLSGDVEPSSGSTLRPETAPVRSLSPMPASSVGAGGVTSVKGHTHEAWADPATDEVEIQPETEPLPGADTADAKIGMKRSDSRDDSAHWRKPSVPGVLMLSDLLLHESDRLVKPLVGNTAIEKAAPKVKFETVSKSKGLPFKAQAAKDILSMPQTELENFLTNIYKIIGGTTELPIAQRMTALVYLDSVCNDPQVANLIIDSSFVTLFVKMLRIFKSASVKIHLLTTLGTLIRYATTISADLSQSGIIPLLAELLRDQSTNIKRRAICTLGELLFFVSTQPNVISPSLAELSATAAMAAATSPQAAQSSGPATGPDGRLMWSVPAFAVKQVIRCLRAGEDDIVRHYAAKTVQNIAAHSPAKITWFSDQETLLSLFGLYSASRTPAVRVCAATGLSLLLHRDASLLPKFIQKVGVTAIVAGIGEDSVRLQHAFVNLLNICLLERLPRLQALLANEKKMVPSLIRILSADGTGQSEQPAETKQPSDKADQTPKEVTADAGSSTAAKIVLRGKVLLALAQLSELSVKWLLNACESGLAALIDRFTTKAEKERLKERKGGLKVTPSAYFLHSLQVFSNAIPATVVPLLLSIADRLGKMAGRKHVPPDVVRELKQSLANYPVVSHLLSSATPLLRSALLSDKLLASFASLVKLASNPTVEFAEKDTFTQYLFSTMEALTQNMDALLEPTAVPVVIEGLLPAVLLLFVHKNGDSRFAALKAFSDITLFLLVQPTVYRAELAAAAPGQESAVSARVAQTTRALNDVLVSQLLPSLQQVLSDKDPMPQYGLKLLSAIVGVNSALAVDIHRAELDGKLLSFFQPDLPNNTLHLVRVLAALARCTKIDRQPLYQAGVVAKLDAMLTHAVTESLDEFIEPLLVAICAVKTDSLLQDMLHALLLVPLSGSKAPESKDRGEDKSAAAQKSGASAETHAQQLLAHNEQLVSHVDTLVALLSTSISSAGSDNSNPDADLIRERSTACLLLLAQHYPASHDLLVTPQNLKLLTSVLASPLTATISSQSARAKARSTPTPASPPSDGSSSLPDQTHARLLTALLVAAQADPEKELRLVAIGKQNPELFSAVSRLTIPAGSTSSACGDVCDVASRLRAVLLQTPGVSSLARPRSRGAGDA